jgi:protein-S-isoprenylcysteine O-methyltransferase Ste14
MHYTEIFYRATAIINALAILACLIYWIITARKVKQTHSKSGGIGSYGHLLLIAAAVVAMNLKIYPLTINLIPFSVYIGIPSMAFSVLGLIIAIGARRSLAGNWSTSVTIKKDHELIRHGLYKYMRHPIYSGVLLMLIGSVLVVGTLGAAAGFVLIFIAFWLKLRQEEKVMIKQFQEEYLEYKKMTKTLIPFIW